MMRARALTLCFLGLAACDSPRVAKPPPPPPLPSLSVRQTAAPDAQPPATALQQEPREQAPAAAKNAAATNLAAKHARAGRPIEPEPASGPEHTAAAVRGADPKPTPSPEAPLVVTTPKPSATGKVSVPSTVHVRIDVPPGLQADLDKDARMQPWVNQVVATLDRCYANEGRGNSAMVGTIEVLVTMHENERPDADIKQLPPALSALVACATGGLMRTKMPLFTGKENARYSVRLRFSP